MKKRISAVLAVFAVAVAAFLAFSASALAAPHFQSADSSVNNSGALVVGFDERGLGNLNVNYSLTADATALYACINGGGKHPQAANKEAFEGQVTGGASFEPKNGRVVASITAGPLQAPQFTCPGGQRRVLAAVTYENIVLTDTSNDESIGVPDVSRTFFTF
jgi:hypothetical protein